MSFESSYAAGQLAALVRFKIAWPAATHPVVRESPILRATSPTVPAVGGDASKPRMTPQTLARQFDDVEQGETRVEPLRKLSGQEMCTTCRKEKHYGPCKRPITIPPKRADFNMGMTADDHSYVDPPSTSPHYTSATSSVSALSRAQEGRPADEQARTGFAALMRPGLGNLMSDEPGRMTGALGKVSAWVRTKVRESRGPSVDPYAERPTRGVPPAGGVGVDSDRAWRSFDNVADSTCIDGGTGTPTGGPAA